MKIAIASHDWNGEVVAETKRVELVFPAQPAPEFAFIRVGKIDLPFSKLTKLIIED
jgi:hypothetical protein